MRVEGIGIGFIDVPQEHTDAYNRWYDQDHVPENLALREITGARRYVATPDCKAVRPPAALPELADGAGTYCTTYLFGEADLAKAAESWHALGQEMRQRRRMFRHGRVPYGGVYRLEKALARKDIPVAADAVPYVGHQGVMIVLTQVADESRRADVDRWFEEVHAPDLLEVPGIAAAMRLSRFESPTEGRYMNLYLLDGDPVAVIGEMGQRRERWVKEGRTPSPGNASAVHFLSPYRSVAPMQYDFRVE